MKCPYKKVAIEAAVKSGLFIKRSVGKIKSISHKGRINIVTDIDRKAEEIIIKKIRRHFPEHSILSEESAPKEGLSYYRWIIDPLDVTTNFAHGFPFFSVSVALEKRSDIVFGIVYDPMREELFTAGLNEGAYLNDKRITVSKTKRLSESLLATGFTYGIRGAKNTNLRNFRSFLIRAQAIRRAGSAALDLCYVACGRFDGFWEMELHPWDSAAGSLIVKESKGLVTRFDGSAYTCYDREILATNRLIHRRMVRILSAKN